MQIYGLIDPRTQELRYVGFTSRTLGERLWEHLSKDGLKGKTHKNHWIKSLISDGVKPEIFTIEETNTNNRQEDERFYISYFRAIGCRLTNGTSGGDGVLGWVASEETRKKMSDRMKGNTFNIGNKNALGHKLSEEARRRISIARSSSPSNFTGKKHSEATKEKLRETSRNRKQTDETKKKLSIIRTGKKMSPETRVKMITINTGRKRSDEENKRFVGNKYALGHRHTEESKLKMSIALKKSHEDRKIKKLKQGD